MTVNTKIASAVLVVLLLLAMAMLSWLPSRTQRPPTPKIGLGGEAVYVRAWCNQKGGIVEHTLPDKTRIDCFLPGQFGAEFDWSKKWAEAVGQSLYYAASTGTNPYIVLIHHADTKKSSFLNHVARIRKIQKTYNFPIHLVCLDSQGKEFKC